MARYQPRHARPARGLLPRPARSVPGHTPRHARASSTRPRRRRLLAGVLGMAVLGSILAAGFLTPAHAATRTLRLGMRGSDVLALERQLASLHYQPGRIDGAFDGDTYHAVLAFQKVNRIGRDGIVGPQTRRALARPVRPSPRYRYGSLAVEVDLTRQVLYFTQSGKVLRIIDVSTGSGQLYRSPSSGRLVRATTPTGTFRITRKINGWRTSALGQLYRPSYFYGGYAIHGSYSVPAYPASHGCVRITNANADRYYSLMRIGMVVNIYRS